MPHDVTMPQLGMAQDAGKIVTWLKAPGDAVAKGDALFEVETDKATMEVEAQANGFLTHVSAEEGEDVSVGAVIARISDTAAEDEGPAPADTKTGAKANGKDDDAQDDDTKGDLPEGKPVTMPQLGMAQDTGLLVVWLKSPGDAVAADDVLFEVETDKSTMEVSAGSDGFLAATLAREGEEVPVGDAVAIISREKPENPVARGVAQGGAVPTAEAPATAETAQTPAAEKKALPPAAMNGRVLASPKARRLALEQGLDLEKLARSGHPQPFHVADLEAARALPDDTAAARSEVAAATLRLTAETTEDGTHEFIAWAARAHGLDDPTAILAGLAAAAIGPEQDATIVVERLGQPKAYSVPPGRSLSAVTSCDAPDQPDLTLRDLRGTPIRSAETGAAAVPVLTVMTNGAGLSITLECAPGQMPAQQAITFLTDFAGRMAQPLRHLL